MYVEQDKKRYRRQMVYGFGIGLIIILVTAGIYCVKYFTGYYKVSYKGTYSGCVVETTKNFTGGRGARVHYWVDVKCESRGLHFKAYVDRYYYTRFAKYPGDTITFYRAENGPFFPTYIPNCDAKEAERELRHIQPPSGWYAAYCLMLLIAIGFLSIGGNGWRMMHSYSDKEEMLDILKVKYGDKQ